MFLPKRARIEMVPLIDCFFLLLVFFIFGVFSMTMQETITVELPAASTSAASKEDALTIAITRDGSLFLDQEPTTMEALAGSLRQRPARSPDEPVLIRADRQVPHGTVIAVLDAIRQAGRQRVAFQTLPEAS